MAEKLTIEAIRKLAVWDGQQADALSDLQYDRTLRTQKVLNAISFLATNSSLGSATALLRRLPEASRNEVNGHPSTELWARYCLSRLEDSRKSRGASDYDSEQDINYYKSIVGAAAIRAAIPFMIEGVPVHDSVVTLPGVGRALFEDSHTDPNRQGATVELTSEGLLTISWNNARVHQRIDREVHHSFWEPARYLDTGEGPSRLHANIDDMSPYRGLGIGADILPAQRLSDGEIASWLDCLEESFAFLESYLPHYAEVACKHLKTIVPLEDPGIYFASRNPAFGILGMSQPKNSTLVTQAFTEGLRGGVFETLHRLHPLHEAPTAEPRYYVPNFDLPVPLKGLLGSLYSHGAAIDARKAQLEYLNLNSTEYVGAQVNYARWSGRYPELFESAKKPGYFMTKTGRHFFEALEAAEVKNAQQDKLAVSTDIMEIAMAFNLDHRLCWRLQSLCPNQEDIEALAAAWETGLPLQKDQLIIEDIASDVVKVDGHYKRSQLVVERVTYMPFLQSTNPADDAYARQEYDEAYELYRQEIISSNSPEAWAGFALTHQWVGDALARKALLEYPEVVYKTYEALRSRSAEIDPSSLAKWLEPLAKPLMVNY